MNDVYRITLHRPEKRNALDRETILWLRQELQSSISSGKNRVVLLSGEGKDFCSGADLSELRRIRDSGSVENFQDALVLGELFQEMRKHPLPIVAAVKGRALAGGCGLATACDVILANEDAQFGYPEVKIGFVPAMVMAILRRSVSEKFAFDLLTTGRTIVASEALANGMVNDVFAEDKFEAEVEKYCTEMASRSASAIQLTKYLLYHMDGMPFGAAIESGAQMNAIARMSEDCRTGIDRFLKKE